MSLVVTLTDNHVASKLTDAVNPPAMSIRVHKMPHFTAQKILPCKNTRYQNSFLTKNAVQKSITTDIQTVTAA